MAAVKAAQRPRMLSTARFAPTKSTADTASDTTTVMIMVMNWSTGISLSVLQSQPPPGDERLLRRGH